MNRKTFVRRGANDVEENVREGVLVVQAEGKKKAAERIETTTTSSRDRDS